MLQLPHFVVQRSAWLSAVGTCSHHETLLLLSGAQSLELARPLDMEGRGRSHAGRGSDPPSHESRGLGAMHLRRSVSELVGVVAGAHGSRAPLP